MFLPELKSKFDEDISILISLDNYSSHFICECGDASGLTVKECQNTEAIFISHTHIDHFINFDFILRHQIGIARKIVICGSEGIISQVQSKIKGYQWNLIEKGAITYEIREIKNTGQIVSVEISPPDWEIVKLKEETKHSKTIYSNERFVVDFTILDHKTASIAYLFKEKDSVKINIENSDFKGGPWVSKLKKAFEIGADSTIIEIEGKVYKANELFHLLEIKKGDTLGVIMDHAANKPNHEKIKSLFEACNKVFIESFYMLKDKEFAKSNYHSYSEASAKIMKDSNVKTAIPVHFSRKYKEDEVNILLDEFHTEFNKRIL